MLRMLLTLVAVGIFASTAVADEVTDGAKLAYNDMLRAFWEGSSSGGHFRLTAKGTPPRENQERRLCKGCLWEYGMGTNVVYAYFKATGAADARKRLLAIWVWLRSHWSEADVSKCGKGTVSTAQDDDAWGAGMALQLYDISRDPAALSYAKAMIDCGWSRWHDNATGDGLWYSDEHKEKSSYQAIYVLDLLAYATASGDESYRRRAVALYQWATSRLLRQDHLYWEGIDAEGVPMGKNRPDAIAKTNSVTFLAGNMAWAVASARLAAQTGNAEYRNQAVATAMAIRQKETTPDNVLIDDRDAFVDGWAADQYVTWVLPLLTDRDGANASTIRATAASVLRKDRAPDGTYGGDWDGPLDGLWENKGSPRRFLRVTANATIWPVVALRAAHPSP